MMKETDKAFTVPDPRYVGVPQIKSIMYNYLGIHTLDGHAFEAVAVTVEMVSIPKGAAKDYKPDKSWGVDFGTLSYKAGKLRGIEIRDNELWEKFLTDTESLPEIIAEGWAYIQLQKGAPVAQNDRTVKQGLIAVYEYIADDLASLVGGEPGIDDIAECVLDAGRLEQYGNVDRDLVASFRSKPWVDQMAFAKEVFKNY